jgi:putative MATE family efflux protein
MSAKAVDMTEGSLGKKILLFSLPLMLSNVLQILFTMADVAVVGRFAGSLALGSVGSTTTLVMLFTGFLVGIGAGVNVLVARFCGARDERNAQETIHTAAILSLLIGLAVMGIGEGLTRPLLKLLGTKPDLIEGAVLYLRIYFLGLPALAVFNFGNAVLSAVGDTKRPLLYLSTSGVLNVILNLVFVISLHMGVAGVALASIVSQYLSALLVILSLLRAKGIHELRLKRLRLHSDKAVRLLGLSIPAGCQNAIFHVANLFIQAGVNSFDTTVVAGNSAAANADGLVYDVMAAFYTACSSFMSQNYGAGKRERILKSYYISLAYSFTAGAALGLLLVIFGRPFLSLFAVEEAVIEAGMIRLSIMGLSYGVSAFMDATIAASRGIGKSLWPTAIVIMGSCVFRVIWVYTVFAHFHTMQSLYLLYVFSWSITAIAEILYFAHNYRKLMRYPLPDTNPTPKTLEENT